MKKIVVLFFIAFSLFADNGFLIGSRDGFDGRDILDAIRKKNIFDARTVERMVEEAAREGGIDVTLAKSIAKVESNFNPKAVSSSNALGVMQLKMDTAVRDIYVTHYQGAALPNEEMLFNPKENSRLGVAYLRILRDKYLKEITDRDKLDYCTIAAYNAGAGTVLRTFHDDKAQAAKIINELSPDEVLSRLLNDMQSEQGRRYIQKVLEAKKRYADSIEYLGD